MQIGGMNNMDMSTNLHDQSSWQLNASVGGPSNMCQFKGNRIHMLKFFQKVSWITLAAKVQ